MESDDVRQGPSMDGKESTFIYKIRRMDRQRDPLGSGGWIREESTLKIRRMDSQGEIVKDQVDGLAERSYRIVSSSKFVPE